MVEKSSQCQTTIKFVLLYLITEALFLIKSLVIKELWKYLVSSCNVCQITFSMEVSFKNLIPTKINWFSNSFRLQSFKVKSFSNHGLRIYFDYYLLKLNKN